MVVRDDNTGEVIEISKVAYQRYKDDWIATHTSESDRRQAQAEYLEYQEECNRLDQEADSFDEWIEDVGYGGSIYVCYDEFCDIEYHDKAYMRDLLVDKALVALYYRDIESDDGEM